MLLKEIGLKIYELINSNNDQPNMNFKEKLVSCLQKYQETDLSQQRTISQSLNRLYKDYVLRRKTLTKNQFIASLKSSGLLAYIKKTSISRKTKQPYNPLIQASGKIRSPDGSPETRSSS